jgi:hypothetical protein
MTIYQRPSISPGARVELINGQFADVIAGGHFPTGTSLILQDCRIAAMPGSQAEHDTASVDGTSADVVIDLQGRYVVPGLFNTHAHLQIITGLIGKGEIRQRQIAKNLSDCQERGVTNIRDTLCWDMRQNRSITDQISRGELLGPRIRQAVHVSPLGGTYAPRHTILNRVLFSMLAVPTLSYKSPDSGVVTLLLATLAYAPLMRSLTMEETSQTFWAFRGPLQSLYGLSMPLGAIVAGVGMLLYARAKGLTVWMVGIGAFVTLLISLMTLALNLYFPQLFGIGGSLILLSFIGMLWLLAKERMALKGSSTTAVDFKWLVMCL